MSTGTTYIRLLLILVFSVICGSTLYAQKYPERKLIRSGNKAYEKGNYEQSEVEYRRALEKYTASYEARFNLGNSLYKQERYDKSAEIFQSLGKDSLRRENLAAAHYNAGNALFQQRKFEEALEQYKESLRINPLDMDAKFNLAYTKEMLKNEQNQQNQNQDQNQDKNKDKDQDKGGQGGDKENPDKDENQKDKDKKDNPPKGGDDKDDKDKDEKDKDKNDDPDKNKGDDKGDKDKDRDGNNNPDNKDKDGDQQGNNKGDNPNNNDRKNSGGGQQPKMSKEEASAILQAIQGEEDKTREKVDKEKKAVVLMNSKKNW